MQPVPPPVDSVLQALMSISRVMRQRLPGDQVEPGTFWLLKNLAIHGSMRLTDLAGCMNLDTSTVSRHISQLERTGLIRRGPDPDDRRAQLVELTAQGSQLLDDGFGRRRAILSRTLEHWESTDLAQLEHLLGRFVQDIGTSTAAESTTSTTTKTLTSNTTSSIEQHHEPEQS